MTDFNELMYAATYILIVDHFKENEVLTLEEFEKLQKTVIDKAVNSLKELKKK